MDAINNILSHFNVEEKPVVKGICPQCGCRIIRRVKNRIWTDGVGQYYLAVDISEIEDYGTHECANGHEFEVIPEYARDGEPVGIKIT